jgi:hypothetical protein
MQDKVLAASSAHQTKRFRSHWRSGMAVLFAAAAPGLAACGGSDSPNVARLEKSSGGGGVSGSTTMVPDGNPTQLLVEWAACVRAHGDPNQADPTVDANNDIDVNWNPAISGGIFGTNKGGQGNAGPGQYCRSYLIAAQRALGGGQQSSSPDQATLLRYAECMRADGIADFPDPVNGTLSLNMGASGDLNPNSPAFENASNLCAHRTGAHVPGAGGTPPPGLIKINGADLIANAGANANG